MGDKSRIEWTDATWTPIRARRRDTGKVGVHCERVSEGCKNCYAASHNKRNLPVHGTGLDFTVLNRKKVEIFVDHEMLLAPLRWKRPRRIFLCSQTDLFGEFVSNEMIKNVMASIWLTPRHTYQILTKRPERMRDFFGWLREDQPGITLPLPNLWLGVTAENQARADERIPVLLQTPAAKRSVSVEPMLGPVNIRSYLMSGVDPGSCLSCGEGHGFDRCPNYGRVAKVMHGRAGNCSNFRRANFAIDWVICGGESGHGSRPMHPQWALSLRDQCQGAGVPFLFKQWGDWAPCGFTNGRDSTSKFHRFVEGQHMERVGKHAAGRILDGVEWNQFPETGEGRA